MAEIKHAVYSGSRNLYADMEAAAKSLLVNSHVDKIWFLIEDAEFPRPLPDCIKCVDVSGQTWFDSKSCPNYTNIFTYMALVRACYCDIFPYIDKVLQLDVDTVVVDDVDWLWECDLTGKWFAAVPEHLGNWHPFGSRYWNTGVAVFNLAQMRKDGAQELFVDYINRVPTGCAEQDAFNYHAGPDRIYSLPVHYNECFCCGYTDQPAIVHYAGSTDWKRDKGLARKEYQHLYAHYDWSEIMEMRGA